MEKPEVLSPVGGWPQLRAAVANGADAVYFGVTDAGGEQSFNARARANNFDYGELPEVMGFLHQHGVKGFACLNVLIFPEEIEAVKSAIARIDEAGVDAVIVQDVGVMEICRRVAPGLEVHASTQASITSSGGACHASESLNVSRVVLGRELSLKEISKVNRDLAASEDLGSPPPSLEVFVHGALCVSYSGQCLSSEAWGGRSANRGQCAQACRMPYGLIVDGNLRDLQDFKVSTATSLPPSVNPLQD